MAVKTLANLAELRDRLAEVDAAIAGARSGASYSIGNRTLTRQDLAELRHERTVIVRDIKRTESALEGVRDPSSAVATWT